MSVPRLVASTAVSLMGLVSVSGCGDGDFVGDAGHFRFESNLGRPWTPWVPAQPVAIGSHIVFDASDITARDPLDPVTPPGATPVLTDPDDAIEGEVTSTDRIEADAAREGVVDARFTADNKTDGFTFEVRSVAGITLHDPVIAVAQRHGLRERVRGVALEEFGSALVLAPGAELAVGVDPVDDGGYVLATDASNISVRAPDALAVTAGQHTLIVGAPAQPGPVGLLGVSFDGAERGTVDVEVVDPADVVALELGALDEPIRAVFVTARLADGRVLRQPPVLWELEAPLQLQDQAQLGEDLVGQRFEPERTDLAILAVAEQEGDAVDEAKVTVRLGALEESIMMPLTPEPGSAPPASSAAAAGSSCGCAARASPVDAAAGILALVLLRRRRRAR